MIKIKNVKINLKDTITCGQIFRYEEKNKSYIVILDDRVIKIWQENDELLVKSTNEKHLQEKIVEYFDLDRNYEEINEKILEKDKNAKEIIEFCNGFKIMKTPHFETIVSYIISQNNGVTNIKKTLDNISKKYGEKIIFEDKEYYLFPKKEKLYDVTKEEFRMLKTGFRDKYLYEFIQKVKNNEFDIEKIKKMNTKDSMNYLMSNKGIGMKVASCILLFGYQKFDVFPIDTWVKKYMKDNYKLLTQNEIEKYFKEKYDEYSGLFIQYIFHYNRNRKSP